MPDLLPDMNGRALAEFSAALAAAELWLPVALEQISDEAPRSLSVLHMYAIPRSLNEPDGWLVSILRSTRQPAASERGIDSRSGVGDAIRFGGIATARPAAEAKARRRCIGRRLGGIFCVGSLPCSSSL